MSVLSPYQPTTTAESLIWKMLESVPDPEVPVLSILDLGIVRSVKISVENMVDIIITPTYSGCPAMDAISMDIKLKLLEHGYQKFNVQSQLSPAWTTDWMTDAGKSKLKAYGIAPPNPRQQFCSDGLFADEESVPCPRCGSHHTAMLSRFGSTACKALYQCLDCREPFDYFKCH